MAARWSRGRPNAAAVQLSGQSNAQAAYTAFGVFLAPDGADALSNSDLLLNDNGLAMSRVDTKDAAHTLGLSDAGKILEIDKARTAMVQQAWTSGASGGYFTLTVNGNTTGHLNYNADHDAVEDALELLLNIGAGNVEVTGPGTGSGNPFVISYDAALGDVGTISIDISHLTGTTPAGAAGTTTAAVTTVTLTIPSFETAAFPQGTRIELVQAGACQIAVSGPSDGTLFCADEPKTATLWSGAILYKRTAGDDPNDWVLIGDLAAA